MGCAAQCLCGQAELDVAAGTASAEWLLADAASFAARLTDRGVFLRSIVGLAELSMARDRPSEAARLLGCLEHSSVIGGRPPRAVDQQRQAGLRADLAAVMPAAELDALLADGDRQGATALIAQLRTDLALTGSLTPH
jgi:hypothetical protein